MITKITEKNTEFYTELFNEVTKNLQDFVKNHITSITTTSKVYTIPLASNVIIAKGEEVKSVAVKPGTEYKYYQMGEEKSVPASGLNEIAKKLCQSYVDVGMGQVTDLEDYFGIIRTISEYIDSNYQILPLVVNDDGKLTTDEDLFEIDANTRTIKMPSSNYTYAVNGDNIAETIYFSIDRYFDAMDLNTKNIAVLSEMNGEKRFTEILLRDTTTLPNKIIFGWPIGKFVTKNSGVLEFSVRFYSLGAGDQINYSFSTLTSKLNIKKGLDFLSTMEGVQVDPAATDMLNLLDNAEILGTSTIRAPIFHLDERDEDRIVNLDNNNKHVFKMAAHSLDTPEVEYSWHKQTTDENISGANFEKINGVITYILMNNLTDDDCKKYGTFYRSPKGQPEDIDTSTTYTINSISDSDYNPTAYDYYWKGTELEATAAGYYQCSATSSKGIRTKTTRTELITIPYPAKIEFKSEALDNKKVYTYVLDSDKTASSDEVIDEIETIIGYNTITPAYKKGVISYKLAEDSDNQYILTVTNSLNNKTASTQFEKTITLYPAIPTPIIDSSNTKAENSNFHFSVTNFDSTYMDGQVTISGPAGFKTQTISLSDDGTATFKGGTEGVIYQYQISYTAKYNSLLNPNEKQTKTSATGNAAIPYSS